MKFTSALIAAVVGLASLADAKGHKVSLKKIPHEDFSLVWFLFLLYRIMTNVKNHVHGAVEHLKQKYMGLRGDSKSQSNVADGQVTIDGSGHPLPLTNFLNAQCTLSLDYRSCLFRLCYSRTRDTAPGIQGRSWHRKFQPLGSFHKMYLHRMFPTQQVRFICFINIQGERHFIWNSIWQWKSLWVH